MGYKLYAMYNAMYRCSVAGTCIKPWDWDSFAYVIYVGLSGVWLAHCSFQSIHHFQAVHSRDDMLPSYIA